MAQSDVDRSKNGASVTLGAGLTVSSHSALTGTEAGRIAAESARCAAGIGIGGGSQTLFTGLVAGTSPLDAETKRIANAAGLSGGSTSRYGA